ncbi:MAG: hypothetical protein AAB211_01375, partial [Pseudomonadota bacterium]
MSSALPEDHLKPARRRGHCHVLRTMQSRLLSAALALGIAAASIGGAQAQTVGSSGHQQIREAVESFIADMHGTGGAGQRIEIVVSSIDPRLPIPACDLPLQTQLGQQSGQQQAAIGRVNVRV